MVARPSIPYRSANAGEFSRDAAGRVDIKQYYSGGIAYKNIEPVPQSGFQQMGGTWRKGNWRKPLTALAITGAQSFTGPFSGTGSFTVWSGTVAGDVAAVQIVALNLSAGSGRVSVEAQIGGQWVQVGSGRFPASASGGALSRLTAFPPGAQRPATALRVRLALTSQPATTVNISSVLAFSETGTALAPRFCPLTTDTGNVVMCAVTAGVADFFTSAGHVGTARLAAVTSAMLPDLDFYAEANTIGLFHGSLQTTRMMIISSGELHDWRVDLWPYDPAPKADLGGVYITSPDTWEITVRYTNDPYIYIALTVDEEAVPAISLKDSGGGACKASVATAADWERLGTEIATAINGLPSMAGGVTATSKVLTSGANGAAAITLRFSGASSGQEFQVSSVLTNTTDASALAYHTQIGKTQLEPLFSDLRGWPGTSTLVQDRMAYGRIPAATGAMALSRIAEYFDLNSDAPTDNAARLDRLRSQTSETIVHIKESKYLLAFTDRGVYFANNRTIERNQPLNFVLASETGAQPNCKPFDLEGEVYYVSIAPRGLPHAADGGKQLLSIIYDDVSTSYNATPVSLLASHLVDKVVRSARQRPETDLDASKGWLMRSDGRLIAAQMIRNQEITGFCEWIAADGGKVREVVIDGQNRLWLAIERAGAQTIELYDQELFLHDAMTVTADLAGRVSGLGYADGTELWAVADGYVLGPLMVSGGAVDLEDPYTDIVVGRWQAPRWESMPQVYVTPGDDVIFRPGRIHTAYFNIIDTTSIAVGANGEPAEDVILLDASDPVDQPMPAKTMLLTVPGLVGNQTAPTLVVTQTKPGRLRVRDLGMGAKL